MLEITPPDVRLSYAPSVTYEDYRNAALEGALTRLRAAATQSPLITALMNLHRPLPRSENETAVGYADGSPLEDYCAGCAPDDDSDERPVQRTVWPCRTFKTLATEAGVPLPVTYVAWGRHHEQLGYHLGLLVQHLADRVTDSSLTYLLEGDGTNLVLHLDGQLEVRRIEDGARMSSTVASELSKELPF